MSLLYDVQVQPAAQLAVPAKGPAQAQKDMSNGLFISLYIIYIYISVVLFEGGTVKKGFGFPFGSPSKAATKEGYPQQQTWGRALGHTHKHIKKWGVIQIHQNPISARGTVNIDHGSYVKLQPAGFAQTTLYFSCSWAN